MPERPRRGPAHGMETRKNASGCCRRGAPRGGSGWPLLEPPCPQMRVRGVAGTRGRTRTVGGPLNGGGTGRRLHFLRGRRAGESRRRNQSASLCPVGSYSDTQWPSQGRVAVWEDEDAQEAAVGRQRRRTDALGCHQPTNGLARAARAEPSGGPRRQGQGAHVPGGGAAGHWLAQAGSSKPLSSLSVPLPGCLGNQAQKALGCLPLEALATGPGFLPLGSLLLSG